MIAKALALIACTAYTAEVLVFEDNFDFLDFKKWKHEITMGGGGNNEFEMYGNRRQNSFVRDGVLYIQPTLTADAIGEDTMKYGTYSIWGGSPADMCTGNYAWGCEKTGNGYNIINPIMSARLRTAETFNFTYGRVEVKAQIPIGDWIWPAIWLLPTDNAYGSWPTSGEIDIMESTGNYCGGGNSKFGSTLHWGPSWNQDPYWLTHSGYTHWESLGNQMHTYGLVWTKDRIYTYFDDDSHHILDVDMSSENFWKRGGFSGFNAWAGEDNSAPFNRDFYLILNVAVGGTNGFFADGQCGKPWSDGSGSAALDFWNDKGWYPTWNYPSSNQSAMKIDSVRVWQFVNE